MYTLSFGYLSKCFFEYLRYLLDVLIHLFSSGRDNQTKAPVSGRIYVYLAKVVCYDPLDRVYTFRNCFIRIDMKAGRAVPWLQALHLLGLRNEIKVVRREWVDHYISSEYIKHQGS